MRSTGHAWSYKAWFSAVISCFSTALIGAFRSLLFYSVICSPVVVFFDRGHPRFWNFYSTIPVDVVRVKSYMNWLFDPARVVIRVTINKLYFVSEWLLSGVVNMIWNGGGLGTGESDVLIMLFNCVSHRSSSFSDVQLAALTFTFIERQQTHICSCSRGYRIKEQKKSQKDVVYFLSARGKSWNKNSQKRKSLKNYSFKYELEITFLLIFYA